MYFSFIAQTEPIKLETIENKLNINQQTNILGLDTTNTALDMKSDSESVNSLKFIESAPDVDNDSKNDPNEISAQNTTEDEFSSFQSSKQETNWTPNLVPIKLPLRETHISMSLNNNVEHNPIYNLESLESFELESTVVTPDLPRKTIEITETIEDDDFNEFQMSTPQIENPSPVASVEPLKPLEPLKPIVLETQSSNLPTQINWPEPGIVSDDLQEFEFSFKSAKTDSQPENIEPETSNVTVEVLTSRPVVPPEQKQTKLQSSASEEDDWSDFVCAQNSSQSEIKSPSRMNLPKALVPQNTFSLFANSQLELSVPNLQNTQLTKTSVLPPTFMPNLSPTKTNSQPSTQQIAAQQIGFGYQPPYQIPLQTISTPFGGLPQTSLSSYNHFSIGPTELTPQNLSHQTKAKTSGVASLFDGPFHPELKPFQAVQNNPESHYVCPTGYQLNSVESTFLKMQQTPETTKESLNMISAQTHDDDDDWTDFVSSQPAPNNLNGFSKQNNFTPNIIANPVHFEAFQSYQPPPSTPSGPAFHKGGNNKKPGNLNQPQLKNKNSIPSISALPDLDFIAPKNKFFSKK